MNIPELVSKHDPQNQFEVLVNSFKQIEFAHKIKTDLSSINTNSISNLIVTGLGGSAIGGDLPINLFNDEWKIPVAVNRNYNLPTYADKNTQAIPKKQLPL